MSICIEVVRSNPFVPNTDLLDWARGVDHLSAKEFVRAILKRDYGLVYADELEQVAIRIATTYPATSRLLKDIARHGGMIQIF